MTTALFLPPLANPNALVKSMGKLHQRIADDLHDRATNHDVESALREAWNADKKEGGTSEPYETYRDAFCDQVAASWILCTVFARTLEDRGYIPHRLAGPNAIEHQTAFLAADPFLGIRDYLLHIFDEISHLPCAKEVFGRGFAPLWRLDPTHLVLEELLEELRSEENDQLCFTFGRVERSTNEAGASTRYLGDLYQNLNEDVRRRYALLQTPDFVERFLLDHTLNPALRERGHAIDVLDPACGSGHLLLGAYDRLFRAWRHAEPDRPKQELAKEALAHVYGIDLNPYAVGVARFRLLASYLDKAGLTRLDQAPEDIPLHVYAGDALLAGRKELQADFGDLFGGVAGFQKSPVFALLNSEADRLLYTTKFDVIVANPPYITEKDAAKRETIRQQYDSATGTFSLSAPFAERIFQLGKPGAYTGQITANSFMKREFGKALVEKVLPKWDLTHVIDSSGAFIPGHGTPTVILLGRSQKPSTTHIPVVMGIHGEPTTPEDPAKGHVWSAIEKHHDEIGFVNEFISVVEVEREKLGKHPWSIGGGGAVELKEALETNAAGRLETIVETIGFGAVTREDELYLLGDDVLARARIPTAQCRPLVAGENVRDWTIADATTSLWPYDPITLAAVTARECPTIVQLLWPFRRLLSERIAYGKSQLDRGLTWFEYSMFFANRFRTPYSITYAEVATHNHFVLDRGGKTFAQTAPIIKLREGATEDEHLALVAYLNSSTACFWMKQVCFDKGGSGIGRGIQPEDWMSRYAFNGSALLKMPLPHEMHSLAPHAKALLELASMREQSTPGVIVEKSDGTHLRTELEHTQRIHEDLTRQMIGLQEDLDWAIYELFGWTSVRANVPPSAPYVAHPPLRPFEMILVDDKTPTAWFERHGRSAAMAMHVIDDADSASLFARRVDAIRQDRSIEIIETPDFKRRWEPFDWSDAVKQACETFLLGRAEAFFQSRDPRPYSIRTITTELHRDAKVRAVAEVLTGSPNVDLESLLANLFLENAVPSATCQVYTDVGIETRRAWERVWDQQRDEDAGKDVGPIDAPPKYDEGDFENATVLWFLRGKLDIPKERFIAYPTATPPPDTPGKPGLMFGWAGWDVRQKLQAAIELWQREIGLCAHELIPHARRVEIAEVDLLDPRLQREFAIRQKLLPILQTMVDLLPWVKQWPDESGQTASSLAEYITKEAQKLEFTLDDVHLYRRPKIVVLKMRRAGTAGKAAAEKLLSADEKSARKRGKKGAE